MKSKSYLLKHGLHKVSATLKRVYYSDAATLPSNPQNAYFDHDDDVLDSSRISSSPYYSLKAKMTSEPEHQSAEEGNFLERTDTYPGFEKYMGSVGYINRYEQSF